MKILVVLQKDWGKRQLNNITENAPKDWQIEACLMPPLLPPVIDEPEDFLPDNLPPAELLLSLGEDTGVAELIPDLVQITGVKAVIAPVENDLWLPKGLQNQVQQELDAINVDIVFPTPFCELTERSSDNEYIKAFAQQFGRPILEIDWERPPHSSAAMQGGQKGGKIRQVNVVRACPCGNTNFVADKLLGVEVDKAEDLGPLFHQYYPCLASVKLIHKAAFMTQTAIKKALNK